VQLVPTPSSPHDSAAATAVDGGAVDLSPLSAGQITLNAGWAANTLALAPFSKLAETFPLCYDSSCAILVALIVVWFIRYYNQSLDRQLSHLLRYALLRAEQLNGKNRRTC